jgi:integrase/DNA-directed RNA polymerase subunit M/transcription elongation factor TFIIS
MVEAERKVDASDSFLQKTEATPSFVLSSSELQPSRQPQSHPTCPTCGSQTVFRNGHRYRRKDGSITQRFICPRCGVTFSENHIRLFLPNQSRHVSAILQEAKNMANLTETKTVTVDENLNGKVIDYLTRLERQGYALATRKLTATCLKVLKDRGANLADPETVKDVLAQQSSKDTAFKNKPWSCHRKRNMINAYTQFLKFNGLSWEPPINVITRKTPFIPLGSEIDDLVAGTPKAVSTMLFLLRETAMRIGEGIRLKWKDVDIKRKLIFCNEPEKGSNTRVFGDVDPQLLRMLDQMPRINECVFGNYTKDSLKATLGRARKRLAFKLGNPRLLGIHFHTLRHWKATMLYHETKDILHVKEFLGHRDIEHTLLYITLESQIFKNDSDDKFTSRVAKNTEECCRLVDVGFEYITGTFEDGGKIFRKRK